MNRIYKVIWNRARHCYVVVSELATRLGKEKSRHLTVAARLTAAVICAGALSLGMGTFQLAEASEPAAASTTQNQYVAFLVVQNSNDNGRDTNTFNGATYHKVTLSDGKTRYWVRDGYTLTEQDAQKYTSLSQSDKRYDVAYTGSGQQPSDILSSATSAVSSTGVSTNAGETLNQVTASAFEGLSQGGGTQVPGNWDYIIYDPSWEGHTQANTSTRTYYKDGYADMYNRSASATGSPLGFVTTTDANSKLVWNGTLNQYTYNGKAVDTSHLYVIGGKLGVFTNYDKSEVYEGTVYGANNEILMTAMKNGTYYSYWAAPVTDPNATMETYRVSDYNKNLATLKDNDVALYHNDIKSVDMTKGGTTIAPTATITTMRNGNGTAQAVDGAITVTGGGGTNGQDTTVTLSNTTNGANVSQTFTTGSKVVANTASTGSSELQSLSINGKDYTTALKFGGDNYSTTTITKNLSEELDILGGADSTKLTDNNIGVNASNGTLKVRLAKDVNLTDAGSLTVGNTKIDTNGLTITHTDSTGASNNVILTGSQISMGGNQITNVASGGDVGTNGANINDIIRVSQEKNQAKGDKNITVDSSTDTSTNIRTTTVKLNDTVTLGSDAARQVILDGTQGTVSLGDTGDANSTTAIKLDGTAGTAKIGKIAIGQQSFDYTYKTPTYDATGKMSLADASATTSGTFVTGLSNTTWTPGNYVSGRAATEDELEQAGRHFLSIKTSTDSAGNTIAENTLANYYNDGATGTNSMAFGVGTESSGNFATSMGINSKASGLGALAVGYDNIASGTESVSVGTENKAAGNFSVALGVFANAGTANTDTNSTTNGAAVAVGFEASATKTGSSAYGYHAQATADEGTALGVASLASVEGGVALGAHSVADTAEGVKGYLAETTDTSPAWVSTGGAVSLGGKTTDEEGKAITVSRQITNLAAGTNDTDAVNVAQLKAVESKGVNFQGNNTDTTVHMNQGGTLQVQGTGTKAATEYSGENILVTGVNETADDGKTVTTKLNIGLDKNIRVDSVTAGQATTDSVQGYAGFVKIVGPSADSTKYEATSLGVGYGTADVNGTNINRLQYIDGDGTTRHDVATLDDGLKLAGDAGSGTVSLDSTLAVTGGETNASKLSSGNNIGVTASDGTLKLQLAKDLTGLNSVTVGTVVMGSQTDGSDATKTGNYVTGLDNKTWTVGTTKAVSGRAATEDQLQSVAAVVDTNRSDIATNKTDIAKGLNFSTNTTDASSTTGYKVVNKALGDTVSIKAHDVQSGHTYKTDKTTSIDDSGNITIAMDTQLTADKVTVGTGSNALTLDGSNGTLTTGSSTLNGTGLTITDGPSLTTSGISGGSKQITKVASGVDTAGKTVYGTTDNAANIGDVKTIASQMVTVSKDSTKNNTKVTRTTKDDGTVDYEVALNDKVALGSDSDKTIILNGTTGIFSIGTPFNWNGATGWGILGGITLGNYGNTGNTWTLTDNKGNAVTGTGTYLTGLTNTSWTTTDPTYVSGRAATEDELAAVSTTVNSGWKARIGGTDVKTITPSDNTLNFVAGDNISLSSDSDIKISTIQDVNFNTARIGGTKGTDGAYTGGIYMGSQAGGGANSGTGFYITGLQNTNWDANSIVSGRAATEDQLQKAINDVNEGTVANDNYVTDGSATDDADNPGSMKVTLTERNKNTVNVSGLHDYYVNGGSVSTATTTADDGTTSTTATLTLNKNNGTSVDVDLTGLSNMDYHLVENSASGSNGAYSVDANGDVKLTVASPTDTVGKEITISGLASKAELDQGLTFTASALADGATSLTHTAQLGDSIGIFGGNKQDGHTYNTNNITTTISDKGDIRVLLDDNLTATSLTAGSKTTDDAAGVDGSVMATGQGGAYLKLNGADGSLRMGDASGNFAAMVQNYGGPKFLNSTAAGSPRIQYWAASAGQSESDASQTLHTLATLEDGLTYAGDNYQRTDSNTVIAKTLNSTTPLSITGGADSTNLTDSNIGVNVKDGALKIQLAKQLTGLTSIALGNNMVLGNQTSGSATGDYLTGLDNTTWSGTVVSGRAATEDQLNLLSTQLKDSLANSTYSITAGDKGNTGTDTVTAKLGTGTIRIFGDAPVVTSGGDGDGWDRSKANILTKVKYDSANNSYVSVELQDHLEVGAHQVTDADGNVTTQGVDGTMQFKGAGASEVNISGDNGITLNQVVNGTAGTSSVRITGPNAASQVDGTLSIMNGTATAAGLYGTAGKGHLLLNDVDPVNAERNADGKGAAADVVAQYGDKSLTDSKNDYWSAGGTAREPGMTRLTYTDQSSKTHQVATMDDGLLLTGDNGTVTRLLNSTLKLSGGVTDKDKLSDGANLGVVANASGDGFDIKLAKDLTGIDTITMTGGLTISGSTVGANYITGLSNTTWNGTAVSGRAATEDQLQAAVAGVTDASKGGGFGLTADDGKAAKADLGGTVGIHGDSNITTSVSSDGRSVNVGLNKDVDLGNDGSIKAGGVTIDSSGIDAGSKNITNVKSGIINHDASDNTNAANIGDVKSIASDAANAAVSGGRVFQGDDGADNTVTVGMGTSLKLTGGQTDTAKLTDGNIGVVKNADGDGLNIKLSKELSGLTSVTTGNSTLNNDGLTINNSTGMAGTTVTSSGIKIAANGDNTHAVEISNSNVSMGGQQIHDVAPGTGATDAVNVSQLGGVVNGVTNAINTLGNRMNRVGAGASALAALHPLEFDPDEKWDFAAGFGHYKNANAAALGAFYRPNEDTMVSIGGSFGGGENMLNAGVAWRIGKGTTITTSRVAMAKEIQKLKAVVEQQNEKMQENDTLRAQVEKQDKEIAELKAMVQQLAAKQ